VRKKKVVVAKIELGKRINQGEMRDIAGESKNLSGSAELHQARPNSGVLCMWVGIARTCW